MARILLVLLTSGEPILLCAIIGGMGVKKNSWRLICGAIVLAVTSVSAFARPIQVDKDWIKGGATPYSYVPSSTLYGMSFCSNKYTQVWFVGPNDTCSSTDPKNNSATGFIQLLTLSAEADSQGQFSFNEKDSKNGQLRVRWEDVGLSTGERLYGEISFYSAPNASAYDARAGVVNFDFDFGYGWYLDTNIVNLTDPNYGEKYNYATSARSLLISLAAPPIPGPSSGLSGAAFHTKYCYRQNGGSAQVGVVGQDAFCTSQVDVPEPTTLALVVSAMGAIAVRRRRVFRSQANEKTKVSMRSRA